MEYLTKENHRYAASLLAQNFYGNVQSALLEADRWKVGELSTITSEHEKYYLVKISEGLFRYRVFRIEENEPDMLIDKELGNYRW